MTTLSHSRARSALIGLTTIWGSTFVVIQFGVGRISPFLLISSRFAIAAVAMALLHPASVRSLPRNFLPALPLSLAILAGFSLQTIGLQSTTPARSAFLTSLSVVIVPIFDFFDTHRLPRVRLLASSVLAGAGIWLLFRPLGLEWHRGDTLTLASAFTFAFYIVELGKKSRQLPAADLAMAQFVSIGLLAGILATFAEPIRMEFSLAPMAALVYLGLVCTALTFVLMIRAQAQVSAVEAAVIYTLEPVIAAFISIVLGREPFQWKMLGGGGLVVAAMLLASTDPTEPHPVAPVEGID